MKIEPEPQNFDPEGFDQQANAEALRSGVRLFNAGEYHAAHEEFERCWLANEAGDADFYKGLVQASICMHHLRRDNPEGATKLYRGHRRLLGAYLPTQAGLDVAALLGQMQTALAPVLRGGEADPGFQPQMELGESR
ncbi:MAG: putative metal-dependent hydrolase [Planctomycetota bacterium]